MILTTTSAGWLTSCATPKLASATSSQVTSVTPMAERTRKTDDINKKYSQTKGLPPEIWEHIFWDASHIKNVEEFTTRAGAYNRLAWDHMDGIPGVAKISFKKLAKALETRRRITLVCKAWYSIGIHILYSHLRVKWYQWEEESFYQLAGGCHHLIAHTKRLTVELGHHGAARTNIRNVNHIHKIAWLCSNLTRLQILEAPGELLAIFALPALPEPLKVFIALETEYIYHFDATDLVLRQFPDAWNNIRVMSIHVVQLQLCLLEQSHSLTFPLLECLRVHETDCDEDNADAITYLGTKWRAPRIRSLTIINLTWSPWFKFLRRHSDTLTTLCTFDSGELRGSSRHEPDEDDRLELPNLRAFYHDWYWGIPTILVANGVQRIGIHDVGFQDTGDLEDSLRSNLARLRRTFRYWSQYPNIKSCCISGWETAMERLEEELEVIRFVDEMEEKGIEVEFMRLGYDDLGFN